MVLIRAGLLPVPLVGMLYCVVATKEQGLFYLV